MYLEATLSKISLEGGNMCWTMSAEKYGKVSVTNVEESLDRGVRRLPLKCETQFSSKYPPW